ncbi:MAG: hypothetical protein ACI9SJ_001551, partial [Flavobacteriaceae bacterium]
MKLPFFKSTFLLFLFMAFSCGSSSETKAKNQDTIIQKKQDSIIDDATIRVGADLSELYLPLLKNKKVGIVANQTSMLSEKKIHLVDFLMEEQVSLLKVFAPEHGFRGKADAGEVVKDGIDTKTGLPILSLYGKNKKPSPKHLEGIDIMIFDIQDVGARFYTYIST